MVIGRVLDITIFVVQNLGSIGGQTCASHSTF